MKTSIRLIGATLGATAIVGTSAVAANAHGIGGHDGPQSPFGSPQGAAQQLPQDSSTSLTTPSVTPSTAPSTGSDDSGTDDVGPGFGHHFGHHFGNAFGVHWFHHQWAGDQAETFAQKQDAIVQRLTQADDRLTDLSSRLSALAAQDPNGWAAQALPQLQEQQGKLESLIAAVKAASNEQDLVAAFKDAFGTAPTGSSTPSQSPTPTPSGSDSSAPTQTPDPTGTDAPSAVPAS